MRRGYFIVATGLRAPYCAHSFLRPRDIITSQAGLSGSEKQQQLLHAIADYYQQQYREACQLRGERKLPVIATGHLTTVGAAKAMRFATFISVRWMPFRRSISPQRIISHWDTFTARNVSAAQSISAIAARHRPQL
ncbi:Nuclease sbcCD subunit D [Salmonella enterica subsp. enterica]|uniref:Nuclease sbcCD subunit D n=1 Tax=Salmonella enterica I TaxID=59201 RepID=A0A379WDP9_SALET|nr:Nuclease sbcCD subunit D [Salmonella enterica subsp. enterica]